MVHAMVEDDPYSPRLLFEGFGAGPSFSAALEELLKAHIADLSQHWDRSAIGPSLLGRPGLSSKPKPRTPASHTPPLVSPDFEFPAVQPLQASCHGVSWPQGPPITPPVTPRQMTEESEPCELPSALSGTFSSPAGSRCGALKNFLMDGVGESSYQSKCSKSTKSAQSLTFRLGARPRLTSEPSKMSLRSNGSELSEFAMTTLQSGADEAASSGRWRDAVHFIMEDPDSSSSKALAFSMLMPLLICTSICVQFVQSFQPPDDDFLFLKVIDLVISALFIIEVIIRIMVYPNLRTFFQNFGSSQVFFISDLAAAVPFSIIVASGFVPSEDNGVDFGVANFLLFCLSPQLRFLKILRYMPNFHLVSHASHLIFEALPTMLVVMVIILWFFSSLLAWFEPRHNLHSLAHCMWMVVVTMTTVGYGDVFPTTTQGYLVCSVLAVTSLLFMAMPLGIIGNIFTSVWKDRDRILLMKKTRTRLAQWGYSARDIPDLFSRFDAAGSGELDIFGFHKMIQTMNIGFDEKRSEELFEQMDADGGGTIDASEFVRHLFPRVFHELYGYPEKRSTLSRTMTAAGTSGVESVSNDVLSQSSKYRGRNTV